MKKILKKSAAVLLVLTLIISLFAPCAVAAPAAKKDYGTYRKYVLLGDSIASGHQDDKSVKSEFRRVKFSYASLVADALGAKLVPLACPGFRTTELRYMVDDNAPTDKYMFHNMHTMTAEEFAVKRYDMRKEIATADLITIGICGNDFVTSLKWVIADEYAKDGAFATLVKSLRDAEEDDDPNNDSLDDLIEFANKAKAIPALSVKLPAALAKGIQAINDNWGPIIENIYKLNPDVTLLVINMADVTVKNEKDAALKENELLKNNYMTAILEVANKVMRDGAEKYGYTYVDTNGAIYDETHPTPAGHRFIADKILDILPNKSFPYTDVSTKDANYKAVEKMYERGIMSGTSKTTFNPNGALTKAVLAQALYTIADKPKVTSTTTFADVKSDSKTYPAIAWACDNGILRADRNGNFNPKAEVSYNDFYWAVIRAGKFTDNYDGKQSNFTVKYGANLPTKAISRVQAAVRLSYLV